MSPEKQREIASKGGRAAHEKGTAHEWTPDEARNAGRKGGQISRGGRGRLMPSTAGDVNTLSAGLLLPAQSPAARTNDRSRAARLDSTRRFEVCTCAFCVAACSSPR